MVDRSDGDTTFTKIFVGGLAWETQRDTMRRYFEQFGEILEAVVIFDKNTGKSKGYGFVTFRDPESARRACENPFPVIDGRRANCNLASLGAQKNRPTATSPQGKERFRQKSASLLSSFEAHSTRHHQMPHSSYPYSYGYPGCSRDFLPMNYYNVYGGLGLQQQLPSYCYPSAGSGSGSHGFYLNYYHPYYTHPGSTQYPFVSQQIRSTLGYLSIPSSASPPPVMSARPVTMTNMAAMAEVGPGSAGDDSEQNSSA